MCMLPKSEKGTPVPEGSTKEDADFYHGEQMQPFNHAGCKVVGGKAWGKAVKSKFLHIVELPTFGKPGSQWETGGDLTWENNPFKKRYPDTWEAELRKTMRSAKVVWINDLVAHTVAEGNRLYKGTKWENTWVMYHDALSAWWDPGAQALLKKLGMGRRQIRAWGPTTDAHLEHTADDGTITRLVNKYRFKLMGDSPEFMPLDRHLFNDVKLACKRNVSLTRSLPDDDKRKFWFNTPKRAFRSLAKTWQHSPTQGRVVEDILEFFTSIDLVVESKGVHVDLNARNGRRVLNFGDTSAATTQTARVRSTRTKEASMSKLEDLHPDAMWCSAQIVEGMHKSDFKVEARDMDLKNIIPVTLDPEELEKVYGEITHQQTTTSITTPRSFCTR